MVRKKDIRTRGKIQLSRYFQEFKKGDLVAIVREPSVPFQTPLKFQGRTGTIKERKGKACLIKIKDENKEKTLLIKPIHLKKIKQIN